MATSKPRRQASQDMNAVDARIYAFWLPEL